MTLPDKLIAALVAVLVLAGGLVGYTKYERDVGAARQRAAAADSVSKEQGQIAANWQKVAATSSRAADSLVNVVRADSFTIAKLRAIGPTVLHVPVSPAPGKPPVLTAVMPEADYDALALAAAKAADDASKALAAKDSVIRADSSALVAMQRRHTADSLAIIAIRASKPSTFLSHFRKFVGPAGAYTVDDKRLHAAVVVGIGYTW